jgi:hypothetical protein
VEEEDLDQSASEPDPDVELTEDDETDS